MTTFRRNRKNKNIIGILAIIVLAVGIVGVWKWMPHVAGNAVALASRPVLAFRAFASDDVSRLTGMTRSKQELLEENEALRRTITALQLQLADRSVLEAENTRLRELVGIAENTERIVARVFARSPETVYGTMLIDQGARDGVQEGARVFASGLPVAANAAQAGNVVLGTVEETFSRMSRVRLYTRGGNMFDISFTGASAAITATGQGAGNFTAQVPQDLPVALGEVVSIAGESVVIGYVGDVEHTEGDSLKTVHMRSPVGLASIDFVSVER